MAKFRAWDSKNSQKVDVEGVKHPVLIVLAKFYAKWMLNDPHYLLGDKNYAT